MLTLHFIRLSAARSKRLAAARAAQLQTGDLDSGEAASLVHGVDPFSRQRQRLVNEAEYLRSQCQLLEEENDAMAAGLAIRVRTPSKKGSMRPGLTAAVRLSSGTSEKSVAGDQQVRAKRMGMCGVSSGTANCLSLD